VSAIEEVNVLVVGNNPTELGHVFDCLGKIPGKKIITEIAFDFASIFERLAKFTPAFILIDDNIGKLELNTAVKALLKYRKTKSIPITVLKNSNYHEAINTGVMNYVLKTGLTGESLYQELKNSTRFKATQLYLYQAYKKRRGQMLRLLK
jgi:hypothetical protein